MERDKSDIKNGGHVAGPACEANSPRCRCAGAYLAACKSGGRGARAGGGFGTKGDGGEAVPPEVAQARAWAERHRGGD